MKPLALLLEDEPLIAMDLETMLQLAGFRVATMITCKEATVWMENHSPDVAIVDVQLQDGPCHEVVAELDAASVPFIVHSGAFADDLKDTVFGKGTWMAKPSSSPELVATARALVPAFA